ncbi:MAG TPA: hypothetical protein PKK91_07000, partial [bacterium]|nr:hypothetical protein [bacterium]
ISGRAAMLSGALKGAGSIPEEWIRLFKPEVLEKIKKNSKLFVNDVVSGRMKRIKNRLNLL